MDKQYGRYLHADGWIAQKPFSADGTSKRTFTVLIASAYNAGIIGSEHNGLVVIDEDNKTIVLDQHLRQSSGSSGPSERQKAEFLRVKAMDWKTFSEFCRTNPRFREGASPDIEAGRAQPDHVENDGLLEAIRTGKASETGTDIRTPAMKHLDDKKKSAEAGGLSFPCRTREQMIVKLANHATHAPDRDGGAISWNIKVYNLDRSGKGEEKTDPQFDARWEEFMDSAAGGEAFSQACSDGLRMYVEDEYTTYPGDDQGNYKFGTAGRSNGHLYLSSWDGPEPGRGRDAMTFASHQDYIDYLIELSPEDLCKLYKLVENVDHDVKEPGKEVAHHLNFHRSQLEQEWAAELAPTP